MTDTQKDIIADAELAARLAQTAGRILVSLRASSLLSGKALGRAGDSTANSFLYDTITTLRPDDGILSEETADKPDRLSRSRVWIIDPLDGTREYGERRDDWAVHVALCIDGVAAVGAVALPDLGLVLRTDLTEAVPPPPHRLRMLVSRTRPAPEAVRVAEALGARLLAMGSAGAKAMAVVRGDADIYLHSGGQYQWDSAAPVAVAAAHGLHCSRIDGSPIRYNEADTALPDLLVCRPEHAHPVLKLIGSIAPLAAAR